MDYLNIAVIIGVIAVAVIVFFVWYQRRTCTKKEFYPETKIIHRIVKYKGGKKNGIEQVFFKTGELNKEKKWCRGKLEGLCETYYKDGSCYIRCNYKDGLLDGQWIAYDMNGKIMESCEYKNGEKVG